MIFKWGDRFVRQVLAYWKWSLSFRMRDWKLQDYPVWVRTQKVDSPPIGSRFKQGRYMARVLNWHIAGIGDTRQEALADLSDNFERTKAEKEKLGERLPRPGSHVPITFASDELIARHRDLSEDFIKRVLELDGAWISDESSLWDFHTDESNDVLLAKIKDVYGVDVSDIESANPTDIFERLSERA